MFRFRPAKPGSNPHSQHRPSSAPAAPTHAPLARVVSAAFTPAAAASDPAPRSVAALATLATALLATASLQAFAATYTVTSAADSGAGTFRQAILSANANSGADIVEFDASITSITLSTALPAITQQLTIDGTANHTAGTYIELYGNSITAPGITLSSGSANSVIKGMYIHGFAGTSAGAGSGILVSTSGCTIRGNVLSGNANDGINVPSVGSNTQIYGNIIGLLADGTTVSANGDNGVEIGPGASNVVIGTSATADRNIISGNTSGGIFVQSTSATIENNYIGTDSTGQVAKGNGGSGLATSGGTGLVVRGNVLSGNGQDGVRIAGSPSSAGIYGNKIGLAADGTSVLGNTQNGINVSSSSASNVVIGTSATADRNIVSGNTSSGISASGPSVTVENNYVGTDSTGLVARANGLYGVQIQNSNSTVRGNLISGNTNVGLRINTSSATNCGVYGNVIGLAADGSTVLPNGGGGIATTGSATGAIIGTAVAADRNVVSGNTGVGISISTSGCTIRGNYIGTNSTGTAAKPNSGNGVLLSGSGATLRDNLISGNGDNGVRVTATTATIHGNTIGLGADGDTILANISDGIESTSAATSLVIGSLTTGDRNVISGNGGYGITCAAPGATIRGNYLGTDDTGAEARGNTLSGVHLSATASASVIDENLASGNNQHGISVAGVTSATVSGNLVGIKADESAALGNQQYGIYLATANSVAVTDNVVSGNGGNGIYAQGTQNAAIKGNKVGTDSAGTADFSNGGAGVSVFATLAGPTPAATIGGTASGEGNLVLHSNSDGIAFNSTAGGSIIGNTIGYCSNAGISLDGSGAVTVQGNLVGIDSTDTATPNYFGVYAHGSAPHLIGGTTPAHRNVVSGNLGQGVIAGSNTIVKGNYIGTSSTGLLDRGNGGNGVQLDGTNALVRANVIAGNDGNGVAIQAAGAQVHGNTIGLGSDGSTVLANAIHGVFIEAAATGGFIGSTDEVADRNVISGNAQVGIYSLAPSTTVEGNYIGTDAAGSTAKPNNGTGVLLDSGAAGGEILSNIVSGNLGVGIHLTQSHDSLLSGNYVGLNAAGTAALPNSLTGIYIDQSTTTTLTSNVVSKNGSDGVRLNNTRAAVVQDNKVGTDKDGASGFGNSAKGVHITSSLVTSDPAATLGGFGSGEGNIVISNLDGGIRFYTTNGGSVLANRVSGNTGTGIELGGDGVVVVQGNIVGLNAAGTAAEPNTGVGIYAGSSTTATHLIGGTTTAQRNVVSGNSSHGIEVDGGVVTVRGNWIGLSADGASDLGNGLSGILFTSGTGIARDNVVSGNDIGIRLFANNSELYGNWIGLAADGNTAIPNSSSGVVVANTATGARIGSAAPADRNVIAGNTGSGIYTSGLNVSIANNLFGANAANTIDLPNSDHAINAARNGDCHSSATLNVFRASTLDHVFIDAGTNGFEITNNSFSATSRHAISFSGGISSNDANDDDTGANQLQNHPVVDAADSLQTTFTGTIDTTANTTVRVELYSSAATHTDGRGPGETYIGATSVTTDGSGHAAWSVNGTAVAAGRVLSALATAPGGQTSHFSATVTVTPGSPAAIHDWRLFDDAR